MIFPDSYKVLNKNKFCVRDYCIVPIRYRDRFNIMKWRNEQIYHLRQAEPLTEEMQNNYFNNVVSTLYEQEEPSQLLFSYLEKEKCIGYGGLVHINWIDRNAEISFIMDTQLEKEEFEKHWGFFLDLLQQVAFGELKLHKIYTYAFDLRPHLYKAVEAKGFFKDAVIKEHCLFDGTYKDVVIHSKINHHILLRRVMLKDEKCIFDWANDSVTRDNSFSSNIISYNEHKIWFEHKLRSENSKLYIFEVNGIPASFLRFDKEGEKTVIGINISPNFRGKKLAPLFLKMSCEKYFEEANEQNIFAYIKKENIASIKSFERAGFKYRKELEINKTLAVEYIYEKK